MRLRGELTPDAVAEMMAQYVTTASAGSSAAHPLASNRSQNVSFILADGRTCERDGQMETSFSADIFLESNAKLNVNSFISRQLVF